VVGGTRLSLFGPHAGSSDAIIARYDSSGDLLWGRQIGGPYSDGFSRICSDGSGGIFALGTMDWWPPISNARKVLTRYDADGNHVWTRAFAVGAIAYLYWLCSDGAGGAYIAGATRHSIAGPMVGLQDCFLGRYDGQGKQLWMVQFGSGQEDAAGTRANDGEGGVFIGGATNGNLGGPLQGWVDAWLARYSSAGERIWLRQFGNLGNESIVPEFTDAAGRFFAIGVTDGSLFGPSNGDYDGLAGWFTSEGDPVWGRQFGSSGGDFTAGAAPDGRGGVYVLGDTDGALAGPAPLGNGIQAFLTYFKAGGQRLWTRKWGPTSTTQTIWTTPSGIAPDGAGGVYVAGRTINMHTFVQYGFLMRFPGPCYPNCDDSTTPPVLNVLDFVCFLQKFAQGDSYANCDQSTQPPLLNIADFTCFVQKFAEGCD
jgi:hypothetical protein